MRTGRRLVLTTVVVALILAGCGGDDDDGGDDAGTTTTTTAPESTTSSIDEAAATEEITTNWEAFFDNTKPLAERVTYLEDGDQLQPLVEQQAAILGEQASQATAQVDNVTLNDDGTANVEFQVLLSGAPVLPSTGTAVFVDGKWLVSKTTLCDLISLAGTTPDECADIAAGEG